MRKINKIMMMTVAILLSLVLITSSVVSGTLAKYTTSSSTSDSARVAKWGVTVEASYGEEFHDVVTNKNETDEGKKVVITPNSDGIGVKITNLKLAPVLDTTRKRVLDVIPLSILCIIRLQI